MKSKIIVGNWKMNPLSQEQARVLASQIETGFMGRPRKNVTTVICPPVIYLPALRHTLHFCKLGAQDLSAAEQGAYTGEIAASQIAEFGAEYVIVGHSERRRSGETDTVINQKIKIAAQHRLQPILCVGFGAKKGLTMAGIKKIVKLQIKKDLKGLAGERRPRIIAYEPVWAIGTGHPATPAHASEIARYIKGLIPGAWVIYGGSLDAKNARAFAQAGLDGGLPGGASLKSKEFLGIIEAFS